ncbi:hypothetical protein Lbir_2544 [Legionella birminghamensis]|uniref:Probable inorganic carbon transporter subunit DabA n=1 Tax=Legionella birminghamensis TaxID=28083 RepID=A0A378I858_9GAMM|nr:DUF2309 domain-containing protein [Legionella birminghamensis]KTC67942.1 hypothetical protein Lbir_2544 [Legionella birminghamensis]STX31349.1 putative transmembrane protein [Legionella birminghamensis]
MTTATVLKEHKPLIIKPKKVAANCDSGKSKGLEIQELVQNAAKCIAPVWPLETFVACNPLQGFEGQTFEEALAQVKGNIKRQRAERNLQLEDVNIQMIKWCGGFFDAGQGSIDMPYREKGFYFGFLKLVCFDKQLHRNKKEAKEFLQQLPESAEEAIKVCLQRLHVPEIQQEAFISKTLAYLPGWAGFVKWKTDWQNSKKPEEKLITLTDFIAVRLVLTCILWPDAAVEKKNLEDGSLVKKVLAQLKNNEDSYRQKLLSLLLPELKKSQAADGRRAAQLVFCIDIRSEPFRRAIESLGHYETFGFAGFFGLPVRIDELDTNTNKACCPVLLKPKYAVKEMPAAANKDDFERYQRGKMFINRCKSLYTQLKHNVSTPFALVESLGLWCGLNMTLKSVSPELSNQSISAVKAWLKPAILTKLAYELSETDAEHGMSLQEQINYAETVLRLMGLTSGFAKLIIFCGHGSSTENNPYASALDCGACGGNHGGMNARLLASILNKPEVRHGLEDRGMHIPLDTIFYGALHNTTTDCVELYAEESVKKPVYPELLSQLLTDLKEAKRITNQERGRKLKSRYPHKDIMRRSLDWSETRPEWGLARNAAFIVAPRHLTKNIHLDGRCFLHSYRFEQDSQGALLETILTAPMVVAEWINTQYLFSTIDNVTFGSGSKITHNVVGTIGVMQGNGSDLMHGLPLQSVMNSDEEAYHEPQRLLTVVYAPKSMVSQVIEKHKILKTLFFNQWVHLIVIDAESQIPYQLNQSGEWILLDE